jgi:hypothetical protein
MKRERFEYAWRVITMDLGAYGTSPFGTQPILDDVIVDALAEPASLGLMGIGCAALLRHCRRMGGA